MRIFVYVLIIFCLLSSPAWAIPGEPGEPVFFDLVPSSTNLVVGDILTVDLIVSELTPFAPVSLGRYVLGIGFDQDVIAFRAGAFGPFLGTPTISSGGFVFDATFPPGDPSGPDLLRISQSQTVTNEVLDTIQPGSFPLATMVFETISAGTSNLNGFTFGFQLTGGVELPEGGLRDGPTIYATPEPSTWLLLGTGLLGLLMWRRLRSH